MSDKSMKRRKRSFVEAWLTDDRYKSWIRKVPSDDNLYHCNICNKNFSCNSNNISRHADSVYHRNNTEKLCSNDNSKKKYKSIFQLKWLEIEQFKHWLREMPDDESLFYCVICKMSSAAKLSNIYRHVKSKTHIDKCKSSSTETHNWNEDSSTQINESLLSFDDRKKEAEIRYAALIAEKNISHQSAKEILSFFQHIKDPNVLRSMKMNRKKCRNIITNVLCPMETKSVVNKIQNTKFSIFIDETSDICNKKWMTFQVRYVDSETLNIRTQLVKLIEIDAKDSSAEKLFTAFKNEMWNLQIPFLNIVSLSCDNASVMTGKHVSFQKELEKICPHLLTFPCPCHSAALAAHAASNKIPEFCEKFTKKIVNFVNSSPKRSAIFREFCECFEGTSQKLLKLSETRWLSHYFCIDRLLKYWDTIRYFLCELLVSDKTESAKDLLCTMDNVETKAYLLFLHYVLNFFNKFNAYFQAIETRIHVLQPKSLQFLYEICQNFIKNEHLKPMSLNIVFSVQENQKNLNEINVGSDCQEYLNELLMQKHEDIVTTIQKNCLSFYVTAAEEIRKRLPVNDIFLSKLNVFRPFVSLMSNDRETSFNDVSFIVKTIGGFDEDALKKEWITLPLDFTIEEKVQLSRLTFDNMWKEILQSKHPNNTAKYPHLKNVLNAIRSLPNSNADPERMFSILTDLKTKKRNKLSSSAVNATCVFKSALKTKGETCLTMTIEEEHLSYMSTKKLYTNAVKKDKNTLRLYAADINDVAGPSWAN